MCTAISYLQYDEPLLCTEDIGNVTYPHSEHQFVKRSSQVAVMEAANVAPLRCAWTLRLGSGNIRKRSVSTNGSTDLLGLLLRLSNLGRVARVWRFNQISLSRTWSVADVEPWSIGGTAV